VFWFAVQRPEFSVDHLGRHLRVLMNEVDDFPHFFPSSSVTTTRPKCVEQAIFARDLWASAAELPPFADSDADGHQCRTFCDGQVRLEQLRVERERLFDTAGDDRQCGPNRPQAGVCRAGTPLLAASCNTF